MGGGEKKKREKKTNKQNVNSWTFERFVWTNWIELRCAMNDPKWRFACEKIPNERMNTIKMEKESSILERNRAKRKKTRKKRKKEERDGEWKMKMAVERLSTWLFGVQDNVDQLNVYSIGSHLPKRRTHSGKHWIEGERDGGVKQVGDSQHRFAECFWRWKVKFKGKSWKWSG